MAPLTGIVNDEEMSSSNGESEHIDTCQCHVTRRSALFSALSPESDYKARLIAAVKKEVKQVMEESVTRKFVHEESGSVTSLCGAVEACLSQGKAIDDGGGHATSEAGLQG